MSTTITMNLRLLTPGFLGGAGPAAELRPPSIKGLLRFWYRAVDPGFREREGLLFGGTGAGAGQSNVLLRVDPVRFVPVKWNRARARRFTKGEGTHAINGLVYLGFALQLPGNQDRTAIPAGTRFTLRCVVPRPMNKAVDRRALLAALWTFATCGALGMRSRRGFGSLALDAWTTEGDAQVAWSEDMRRLPLLADATDVAAWKRGFDAGRKQIRGWLGELEGKQDHPHLGPGASAVVTPDAFELEQWEEALNHAGVQLQKFRQRMAPDYENVRNHLRSSGGRGESTKLRAAPERAAFGLPLKFQYSSLGGRSTTFVPHGRGEGARSKPLERHPSTLLLKLVPLPDGLHALWLRLAGPQPGSEPRATERGATEPLERPSRDAVGAFLQRLRDQKEH